MPEFKGHYLKNLASDLVPNTEDTHVKQKTWTVFTLQKSHRKALPQRCSEAKESASSAARSRMPPITATQASVFTPFEALLVKMMASRVYFSVREATEPPQGTHFLPDALPSTPQSASPLCRPPPGPFSSSAPGLW